MSEAEKARRAAQGRLEDALMRDREVEEIADRMSRHDVLNNYTRLLIQAMIPEVRR
jgi:hypothetical protein